MADGPVQVVPAHLAPPARLAAGEVSIPATVVGARAALSAALGSPSEARWLVEEVLGPQPLHPPAGSSGPRGPGEALLDPAQVDRLAAMAARRLSGEPLQYVLGHWSFRQLDLRTDPRALIPRPETEVVVEVARRELDRTGGRPEQVVVDLGTGTGAIALALVTEDRTGSVRVWATDVDSDTLALAAENVVRAGSSGSDVSERVHLCPGSWWEALPAELAGSVDLVVANPPYVAESEWAELSPEVRAEPRRALVAGSGRDGVPGMAAVEEIVAGALSWLRRPGSVVVEIAPSQASPAARWARRAGFAEVAVLPDLTGRDRILVGRT